MNSSTFEDLIPYYIDTCFDVLYKNIENYIKEHSILMNESEFEDFIKFITNNVMNTSSTFTLGILKNL